MIRILSLIFTTLLLMLCPKNSAAADNYAADSFSEAIASGHAELTFRYRYEFVDKEFFARDANASTLKTRLNYNTQAYKGVSFFIEVDNVTEILGDNYNAGAGNTPNRSQYPVVADPTGTEINQAWFNLHFSDHDFKLGRQRIIFDNQRFIGGVAWRQNEQTYDAAHLDFELGGSHLQLAYVDRVNRIFGEDVPAGDHDNNTLLANWSKTWQGRHRFVLFHYDIDNKDVAAFSTQTTGLAFDSFLEFDKGLLSLGLDYAKQTDGSNNPVDFNASYWRVETAFETAKVDFILGREVLQGHATKSGAAFRTPLATLHAFNGWSDQFLGTPDAGLKDTYIGMIGSHNKFSWYVRYHDFDADSIKLDYGTEFDVSLSYKFNNKVSTRLKYAQYKADNFSSDSKHLWFLVNFEF